MRKNIVSLVLIIAIVFSYSLVYADINYNLIESTVRINVQFDFSNDENYKNIVTGHGSGFAIKNDTVITCYHVIDDIEGACKKSISISTNEKGIQGYKTYSNVKIIYVNTKYDIAILKVKGLNLKPLDIDYTYKNNDKVSIISGNSSCYWKGNITNTKFDYIENQKCIKTSTIIHPGDSGSPLIKNGKVIGIAFGHVKGSVNNSLALPINRIKSYLRRILK